MPASKDLDPYVSARAFYGAELRRLREAAGLTQDALGELAFCSGAYIGQFEAAVRQPQPELSKAFDQVLGSGEHLQRLCRLARQSKHADYFADVAELELLATTISQYATIHVPGLLQTEAYARGIIRASLPYAAPAQVESRVRARLDRSLLLDREDAPEFWAIIHETCFGILVDSGPTMAAQLTHLRDLAADHPRVVLQVMPSSAGPHPLMGGLTIAMTFADSPPIIYNESAHTGQLIEEPALVAKYLRSYDHARAAALSPKASLTLIASAVRTYRP
ncbi:helix-turn-helix transcriptional regulator [Yinghuangia aomiensis]|uniref:Helix-turn-helix transcriptional regulator n=1 Tax=Yinghuangia aomiensis TaxID=676205 RepID=A0ABP9HC43_9ACTN